MRTYRNLFRTREFTPLLLTSAAQTLAQAVGGPALGILVFGRTGSALLSSLATFGPALAQAIGAVTVLSAADRLPPRAALTGLALLAAAGTAVQAVPGLPLWALFTVVPLLGVLGSLGGGVRYGLADQVLTRDGYLLGRSVLAMAAGLVQICGFAAGGLLVAAASPRGALLTAAAVHLLAAATAGLGLRPRPPRATGRPSVRQTWRTDVLLWSAAPRRAVYLALWVPNGLIVGAESLYVPYAPGDAGLLLACGALGMLAGDTAVGRLLPARHRNRATVPLCLLLAAPYLLFPLHPPLLLAAALATLAAVGYSSGLLLQDRLLALTPTPLTGQALGLHTAGMLAAQGLAATLAGAAAELTSPTTAMALAAAASLTTTLTLAPRLTPRAAAPSPAPR